MTFKLRNFIFLYLLHWQSDLINCAVPVWECDVYHPDGYCLSEHNMASFILPESELIGNVFYTLMASDPDNGTVTYEIIPTNPGNIIEGTKDGFDYFIVGSESGDVSLKTLVDYEDFGEIRPTWRISSGPDAEENFVRVLVQDVNDNYPLFQGLPYTADPLPEDSPIGSTVFNDVNATDNDTTEDFHEITYNIVDNLSGYVCETSAFTIDQTSGTILQSASVSYKMAREYTICIEARDQGIPLSLATYTTLKVTIIDVQGDPPVFRSTPYKKYIYENTPVGNTVVTVFADDGDTGVDPPNLVEFNLISGNDDGYFIMTPTGVLMVNQTLDMESKSNFMLTARAKEVDLHQPLEQITSHENITITILDVNDNKPVFDPSSETIELLENAPELTSLKLHMSVTDADAEEVNANFRLSLSEKTTFQLGKTNVIGSTLVDIIILDNTELDREINEILNIQIYATEQEVLDIHSTSTSTANVTVVLLDVNDNPPIFEAANYECFVIDGYKLQNETGDDCQVTALDADMTEINSDLNYTIVDTADKSMFHIDAKSGNISLTGEIDPNGSEKFHLKIEVNNTASPYFSDSMDVTIRVIGAPTNPTERVNLGIILGFTIATFVLLIAAVILFIIVTKKYTRKPGVSPSREDVALGSEHGSTYSHSAWTNPPIDDGEATQSIPQDFDNHDNREILSHHSRDTNQNDRTSQASDSLGDGLHTESSENLETSSTKSRRTSLTTSEKEKLDNGGTKTGDTLSGSYQNVNAAAVDLPNTLTEDNTDHDAFDNREAREESPTMSKDSPQADLGSALQSDKIDDEENKDNETIYTENTDSHDNIELLDSPTPSDVQTSKGASPEMKSKALAQQLWAVAVDSGSSNPLSSALPPPSPARGKGLKRRNRRRSKLLKPAEDEDGAWDETMTKLMSITLSSSSERRRKSLTPMPSEDEDESVTPVLKTGDSGFLSTAELHCEDL